MAWDPSTVSGPPPFRLLHPDSRSSGRERGRLALLLSSPESPVEHAVSSMQQDEMLRVSG
eukprot:5148843-Prorocentrum_lima.AAC.1